MLCIYSKKTLGETIRCGRKISDKPNKKLDTNNGCTPKIFGMEISCISPYNDTS